MGVPTITLAGSHYVSRMSTFLMERICRIGFHNRSGYIDLASGQAERISELRASRHSWRRQLQASPLGNAADAPSRVGIQQNACRGSQ